MLFLLEVHDSILTVNCDRYQPSWIYSCGSYKGKKVFEVIFSRIQFTSADTSNKQVVYNLLSVVKKYIYIGYLKNRSLGYSSLKMYQI